MLNIIISILLSIVVTAIVVYLWLKKYKELYEACLANEKQLSINLENIKQELQQRNTLLQLEIQKVHATENFNKNQLQLLQNNKDEIINQLKLSITSNDTELARLRDIELQLNKSLENARVVFKNQNELLDQSKKEKEELNQKLKSDFEVLANKILDEKTTKFTEQNKNNLEIILNPFKEQIKQFEVKVDKAYKEENNERITLKAEIKNLMDTNKRISDEANNLTKALKGDTKKQGNWGEVILDKILESSGLRKGEEYETQFATADNDNNKQYPDVIIKLPENKHIIIDSKVSLVAYEQAVNAETDEQRVNFSKLHITSIKSHIKLLSEKNYINSKGINSPEFVLLFFPIESMFSLAIKEDVDIYNFAWEKRIVIVSPSTLFATLKTVESIWKREKQNKHAVEIAEEGGKLFDKFSDFINDMEALQKSIFKSQEQYDSAFKKLSTGNNNIIKQVDRLRELGAKANKTIDPKYLDK